MSKIFDDLSSLVQNWRDRADKYELAALEAESIGDMPATVQHLETTCAAYRLLAGELELAILRGSE